MLPRLVLPLVMILAGAAGLYAAPPQSGTPQSGAAATRPAGVAAQDAVLAFNQPIAITIWYDPNTLIPDEILVPSQNAVLTRERS